MRGGHERDKMTDRKKKEKAGRQVSKRWMDGEGTEKGN